MELMAHVTLHELAALAGVFAAGLCAGLVVAWTLTKRLLKRSR